MPDYMEAYF